MWGLTAHQVEEAFRTSDDLICNIQFGGYFMRLNSKWTDTLGWSIEEFLSKPYIEFVHPKDIRKTLEYEKNFIPTGFVNRLQCKDGSYRWLSWIGLLPIDSSDSKTPFSIVRDITLEKVLQKERKKQIKFLNQHLEFKNKILQTIVDLQWAYLGDLGSEDNIERSFQSVVGHLVHLSNSQFGYLAELTDNASLIQAWDFSGMQEPPGKEELDKIHTWVDDILSRHLVQHPIFFHEQQENNSLPRAWDLTIQPSVRTLVAIPLLSKREQVGVVVLANRKPGYSFQVVEWLNPLLRISALIVSEIKLTRAFQASQNEQIARYAAEEANEIKSAFLAHMSHELRTPLSSILGVIDIINKGSLSSEDQGYLEMAKESGYSLLTLLNDILDMSKIEKDQLTVERIPFHPIKITEEIVQLFGFQTERKGISLQLSTTEDVPTTMLGDPTRFRQILLNLIGNAIKFTNQGSVTVDLQGHYKEDKPIEYQLVGEVIDTGIGMDEVTKSKLFQSFSQADDTMARRFGGSGLGLFITRRLCKMMGGDITVTSALGQGSVFHFEICCHLPDKEMIIEQKKEEENLQLPPLSILIAEDNPVNQVILKTILRQCGCPSITIASNGEIAVEAVRRNHFDVVLMDGQMPIMDGLEATQLIRKEYDAESLPIIGITAHAMVGDSEKFLSCGMNSYLTKPVQREELVREILRCLKQKKDVEQWRKRTSLDLIEESGSGFSQKRQK